MSKLQYAVIALVIGVAPAFAAAPKTVKILSFTGQIQISIAGKTVTVQAGDPLPKIPAGAQITVISGEAVLQGGNAVVSANAGDSFSFNNGPKGSINISVAAGAPSLTVGDSTTASLTKGDIVSVSRLKNGAASISVVAGEVAVITDGQTQNLEKGQLIAANMVPTDLKDAPKGGGNDDGNNIGNGFGSNNGNGAGNSENGPNPNAEFHQLKNVSKFHP